MKTILITGASDGIGLETAKALVADGHRVLLHGRSAEKLNTTAEMLDGAETYRADLSDLSEVVEMADAIAAAHGRLDVLINNAGVLKAPEARTEAGLDIRFVVNTLAPYLLTRRLLPLMGEGSRVVNLSSAAQAPVDLDALRGMKALADMPAYAQSKLALTAWTKALSDELGPDGPVIVSINPGSLLGTKMVRDGFGTSGNDIGIGVDILTRAALSPDFADARGRYWDNDARAFGPLQADAGDPARRQALIAVLDELVGL